MPLRDSILAFVVSLVVVAELTVLVHYTGDRFSRTEDTADVTRITGLPVLAKIPKGSGIELTEAFRVLRTNLMVLEGAGKPRTLAVVSSNQSAGKTFTAVHLAQSAAGLDEKVVIVDADLRKPSVHERLGVPRAPGLSAVLQGNDLATMLRKLPDTPFLRVLASGAPVQDASGGARRPPVPPRPRLLARGSARRRGHAAGRDVRGRDGRRLPVRRNDLRARREDEPSAPGAPDARSTRACGRQPGRRRGEPDGLPPPVLLLLRVLTSPHTSPVRSGIITTVQRMVVVSGWTGAGKSTLANAIASELSCAVGSFDWLMAGLRSFPEVWDVVEAPVERQRAVGWSLLNRLAEQELRNRRTIVLDLVCRESRAWSSNGSRIATAPAAA